MNKTLLGVGAGGLVLIGIGLLAFGRTGGGGGGGGGGGDDPTDALAEAGWNDLVAPPTFHLETDATSGNVNAVRLIGVQARVLASLVQANAPTDDWQTKFAVYTGETVPTDEATPAVIGRYSVDEGGVRFVPRFPLDAGMTYSARVQTTAFVLDTTFVIPTIASEPTTVVTAVYPSASTLLMNQLRMYIHFSGPMRIGDAYESIRLVDQATDEDVADPFVIIEQELWDPEKRRFTLLFDPGRIKRGLVPHEQVGLPLQQGRSYRLIVDPTWRDANGRVLARSFEKSFSVVGEDRESPRHNTWNLSAPGAATREAVSLVFPEPLDHALLQDMLAVRTADGEVIAGSIYIGEGEREWFFVPDEPWTEGSYVVVVDAGLEDLAGNNLRRLFDVNLETDRTGPLAEARSVEKTFVVR